MGHTTEVESASPDGAGIVRLTVTPQHVERVEPAGAQMSFLLPDASEVRKNVISSFCHFVHFFPSRQAAENWTSRHAGTFVVSIHEGHILARLKNETQYREVLR